MTAATLGLALLMMNSGAPARLRCFDTGIAVKRSVRAQIEAAVRRCSRFPVVRLELVEAAEQAPAGTIAALTLVRGECGNAIGDTFWVHRGVHGWRVLKKANGWGQLSQS